MLVNKQMPTNTRDPVSNPAAMPDAFYRNAPVSWKGYSGGEKCVVDKVRLLSWYTLSQYTSVTCALQLCHCLFILIHARHVAGSPCPRC